MHIDFSDCLVFLTGVPGSKKCLVSNASSIAISTIMFILDVLNTFWFQRLLVSVSIFSASLSME